MSFLTLTYTKMVCKIKYVVNKEDTGSPKDQGLIPRVGSSL